MSCRTCHRSKVDGRSSPKQRYSRFRMHATKPHRAVSRDMSVGPHSHSAWAPVGVAPMEMNCMAALRLSAFLKFPKRCDRSRSSCPEGCTFCELAKMQRDPAAPKKCHRGSREGDNGDTFCEPAGHAGKPSTLPKSVTVEAGKLITVAPFVKPAKCIGQRPKRSQSLLPTGVDRVQR